jgi:hypothetical protein
VIGDGVIGNEGWELEGLVVEGLEVEGLEAEGLEGRGLEREGLYVLCLAFVVPIKNKYSSQYHLLLHY